MHFWTPKRLFHTKLMKKTLFYSKSLPYKSILSIQKKHSGEKVTGAQNHKNLLFFRIGGSSFFQNLNKQTQSCYLTSYQLKQTSPNLVHVYCLHCFWCFIALLILITSKIGVFWRILTIFWSWLSKIHISWPKYMVTPSRHSILGRNNTAELSVIKGG